MAESCGTCRFFNRWINQSWEIGTDSAATRIAVAQPSNMGSCRRYPPATYPKNFPGQGHGVLVSMLLPEMSEQDWCGEFAATDA
jgi:hypothetical protein